MSDAELERAATAPSRWIALSYVEAKKDDHFLPPRVTRVKDPSTLMGFEGLASTDLLANLYLVPGGRYLVIGGQNCLGVWDLGYNTNAGMSSDENIWTAPVDDIQDFIVHPTPDGLGIRILTYSPQYVNNLVYYTLSLSNTHSHCLGLMTPCMSSRYIPKRRLLSSPKLRSSSSTYKTKNPSVTL